MSNILPSASAVVPGWNHNNSLDRMYTGIGVNNGSKSYYLNGRYWVIGLYGKLAYSTDGITWTPIYTLQTTWSSTGYGWDVGTVTHMAYGGGVLIVVSAGNSNTRVATSTDNGNTWADRTSALTSTGFGNISTVGSLVWDGTYFLILGYSQINYPYYPLAKSTNGVSWTYVGDISGGFGSIGAIILYAGGQYVAYASHGRVATSTNGSTWTVRTSLGANTSWRTVSGAGVSNVGKLVYALGLYIQPQTASIATGGNIYATSSDAITWTVRTGLSGHTNVNYKGFTYFGSTIVAFGTEVIASGNVAAATSTDGINWTARTPGLGIGSSSATIGASNGTTAIFSGGNGYYISTTDGINYTQQSGLRTLSTSTYWVFVYVNGLFHAFGQTSYTSLYATSPDAVTWTTRTVTGVTTCIFRDIAWTGTNYVLIGSTSTADLAVATSPDLTTWTDRTATIAATVFKSYPSNIASTQSVAYDGTRVTIANIYNGYIATSTDHGVTWAVNEGLNAISTQPTTNIITANNSGTVVASAAYGKSYTSSNAGTSWTFRSSLGSSSWGTTLASATPSSIVWVPSTATFVIGGAGGRIATSTDGITWVYRAAYSAIPRTGTVANIGYANGSYFAGASSTPGSASTAYSTDGCATWTGTSIPANPSSPSTSSIFNVNTVDGGLNIGVMQYGAWYRSSDNITWTLCTSDGGVSPTYLWTTTSASCISYLNGRFWFGGSGCNVGFTSDSTGLGLAYNAATNLSSSGYPNVAINDIGYYNGTYVCISASTLSVATSTDRTTWTTRTGLTSAWTTGTAYCIFTTPSWFIIGGSAGKLATSTDGITWTNTPTLSATAWGTAIVRKFLLVGSTLYAFSGATGVMHVASSSDYGATWSYITSYSWTDASGTLVGITYARGLFVAMGANGAVNAVLLATSPDGINWTTRTPGFAFYSPSGPVFAAGTFYAGGNGGQIISSLDGITWSDISNVNKFSNQSVIGICASDTAVALLGSSASVTTFSA